MLVRRHVRVFITWAGLTFYRLCLGPFLSRERDIWAFNVQGKELRFKILLHVTMF